MLTFFQMFKFTRWV